MTHIYAVYSAGGFGREIMPALQANYRANDVEFVFVDDNIQDEQVNGVAVLTYEKFTAMSAESKKIVIAVADSKIREKLADKCEKDGIQFINLIANNAIAYEQAEVQEGLILFVYALLTVNVKVGRHCHISAYSYIGHDCTIGDFVTFAPRVSCNGNVVIEDHAYIGTGAIIKQGTAEKPVVIGRGAVIGMGAVVTKSVPAGVTVVGNPARVFEPKAF